MNDKPKIYVNSIKVKEIEFERGSIIKLNIKLSDFSKFIKENKDESGYINLVISKRKEAGKNGETHYITLDTWKPNKNFSQSTLPKTVKPVKKVEEVETDSDPSDF